MVRRELLLANPPPGDGEKGGMGVQGGRGLARLWADEYCCAGIVER
jgi:hypothetical protein